MRKIEKFKQQMANKGFDAAVISSAVNQRYLTGFDCTDGYVLVLPEEAFLLADFRYIEAANILRRLDALEQRTNNEG